MDEEKDQIGYIKQQISPKMFEITSIGGRVEMNTVEFKLVKQDIGFLKLFLELCLERWDFTSDEQSSENLKSIINFFQVIWLQEEEDRYHNGRTIINRVMLPEKRDIQIWSKLYFELKRRIHQTKLLMEGWCVSLLPSLKKCNLSSTIDEFKKFLSNLFVSFHYVMDRFSSNFPIKNIHIMIKMLDILFRLFEDLNYYSPESKNCNEFLNFFNFACAFTNKAACFTCLSWAKQGDIVVDKIETATELNIVLFAMIHEFIPCAPDVTAWCFRIFSSTTTEIPQSVYLEETVEKFVWFFYGHLRTTLMDGYPILRDRLIYLFTFLTDDHPCVKADEDITRSQIYALFREDVYPLLSFNETKEDFSNNNIILRDFINKIEIANDNIRQHYYAFSYSWIGSEAVKMDYFYFVSVMTQLIEYTGLRLRNQIKLYVMELGLIRVSLLWFASLDDGDEEIRSRLNLVIISLQRIWGKEEQLKGSLASRLHKILNDDKKNIADWRLLAFELEGKIELSKLEISTQLLDGWFHWSLRSKPSSSNKVLKFLDLILHNINALVRYKAGKILPFKKQTETLKDKITFMRNMMKLVENCSDSKDLGEFILFVQLFANEAAHLTILFWLKDASDKSTAEINLLLCDTLRKIKPSTPCVARLYFKTLETLYLQRSDSLLFGQTASIFVDYLLEDSVTLFKDDFQILHDELIFLLTFLNDPPKGIDDDLIFSQIDNAFWEDVCGIMHIDDKMMDFSHKMVRLSGFMMKIKAVNTMIGKLYCEFPDSSLYDLPKITSPWYLDFLIRHLRDLKERMITDHKFVPFVKYKTIKLEEELVSLSPFFSYIFELQNELNDTWLQVVDLIHLTERVINSCISSWFVFDHPIWYYMSYISHVLDKIKAVKKTLEKVKEKTMDSVCCLPHPTVDVGTHSNWRSKINEEVVGFEDETRQLIENLTMGPKSLDIVSIVGMGGLGKTTLARKASSSVKDHFHIMAFYTVSQDHNIRMLLLGILEYIIKVDDKISRMTNDDLAHKLWKCLSRRKYLIVLDDVWHIRVWNEVKKSLPDNKNGSRVMFTTRFYDVANDCKMECSPFKMPFMSQAESWELLQKKVFQDGISPPNLSNVGKQIAESCKGLPLAIVVIAGVLARKERSESSWNEIAEKVFSFLSDEGCMKILELSYDHLPGYLKPCILYLGAFPEDKLFMVNQVARLWIAEGFVHEYEAKSVDDVAREYIQDLVDRSLLIVSSKGLYGNIRSFNVHDLIHKLCQAKCHEENFFKLGRGIATSASLYDHYRISDLVVPPTISGGSSSHGNASTLLLFTDKAHQDSFFKKLKLVRVLYLECKSRRLYMTFLTSSVNLRHIEYHSEYSYVWLPPSISNIWNIQSLILTGPTASSSLPETVWKMKSLRHVKVGQCMLQFSDDHEHEKLDKVISFSKPIFFSGKEVQRLLQRLPVVRKLEFEIRAPYNVDTSDNIDDVNTLDFFRELESLKIFTGPTKPYSINFPSTLKKLTLGGPLLCFTHISSIAELKFLRFLKLETTFMGSTLEMEDLVFNHLVHFELYDYDLEEWNASTESLPCLEQLFITCTHLKELPPCLGEMPTLKRIYISSKSTGFCASALRIRDELTDLGNKVEFTLNNE